MAEWYKLHISDWNEGTDALTLEQEAAYLRVVNAIRQTEKPISNNHFVLGGLWRCNDRKAKRLLRELVEAGKLVISGDSISNPRAADDASTLRRLRADRASAGSRGGVESAKTRAKSLETNDTDIELLEADKTRQDKSKKERKEPPSESPKETEKPTENQVTISEKKDAECDMAFRMFSDMAERAGLPVPAKLSKARKSKLLARLKDAGGIKGWEIACDKVAASSYCTGKKNGWRADFEFMLRESRFMKIMEGSYDDIAQGEGQGRGSGNRRSDPHYEQMAAFAEVARRGPEGGG